MAVRLRATVAYDGTDFHGFQWQADSRTVQGELETAIARVGQREVRVLGAGRTDAGVHAVGQVVAFDASWRHSWPELQRALNAVLPGDIAILDLVPVGPGFHPRFEAIWRHYRYTILNQPVRAPLCRRYAHHVSDRLDVDKMREAARFLRGRKDFAAFGRPPAPGTSTVREVREAEWAVSGTRLVFDIIANAFLYRMVRNIVGTLVRVGRGGLGPEQVAGALEAGDPSLVGPAVPARGLCLVKVEYP